MKRLRFVGRLAFIVAFLALSAIRFFIGWLLLALAWRPRSERKAWFARCLVALFRRLGATFIKVGQIMSTRPDLFPPHIIAALETLQDAVGPFPYRAVVQTFVEDFGKGPDVLFRTFSVEPIASASVAQVHRAELPSGRCVAVKVRRPEIEELCEFDLAAIRIVARVLALSPSLSLLAPVESVD